MVPPPLQRLRNRRKEEVQIVMLTGHSLGGVTQNSLNDVRPFAMVTQPSRNAPTEIVRGGRLATYESDVLAQPRHRVGHGPALCHIEEPLACAGAIACLQKERRSLRREWEHLRPTALGPATYSSPAVQSVAWHDPDGPFVVRVSIATQISSLGRPDLRASRRSGVNDASCWKDPARC